MTRDTIVERPTADVRPAPVVGPDRIQSVPIVPMRDAVRWGPIWAGLLVAITSFLLLSLLTLLIGAQTLSSGADVNAISTTGGWVTAGLALLAFLIGGFVAGRTSGVPGRGAGLLNGFLVFALGVVVIAVLSGFGLGQLFGAIGQVFAQFQALGGGVTSGDPEQAAQVIRDSALIAFVSMALPALAAAIGGLLGARGTSYVEAY